MTEPNVISEVWAWISSNEEGEGVLAVRVLMDGELTWMPLIGADAERMNSLRPQAIKIANERQITVKLIHLTTREDLETYGPGEPQ